MITKSEDEIKRNWTSDIPLVSIDCITYNQEKFIEQTLDGFLLQQTNFAFEILIHDDCSSDSTVEIIKKYEKKFPSIIKPIYEEENIYSKYGFSKISDIQFSRVRGKYIASCEGDDYWIDNLKLQKQVNFLEKNKEYSMCFHNALEHYENMNIKDKVFAKIEEGDYSSSYIFKNWIVPTASVVFRTDIIHDDFYNDLRHEKDIIFGDLPLFLSLTRIGKIYALTDVMSVYRRHENGTVYGFSAERNVKHVRHNIILSKYFPELKWIIKYRNMKIIGYTSAFCLIHKKKNLIIDMMKISFFETFFIGILYVFKLLLIEKKRG